MIFLLVVVFKENDNLIIKILIEKDIYRYMFIFRVYL